MPKKIKQDSAKFRLGQMVRHKVYSVYGVIIDVDFEFNQSDEWLESIPKDIRPHKKQPFYHLLADNGENTYIAYVSEQNLEIDETHPEFDSDHEALTKYFIKQEHGYQLQTKLVH